MAENEQIDLLTLPVLMATEMAWRQVQEFVGQMPAKIGRLRPMDIPSRLNLASVEQLLKGD